MAAAIKKIIKAKLREVLPGNSPDFIIVGSQKAGTTSLHHYLNQHPNLVGSIPKEVNFFDLNGNYNKGTEWYHDRFKSSQWLIKKSIYYESSPDYLFSNSAAKLISEYKPAMKIIVILREPVSRALSAWNMYRDVKESGKPLTERIRLAFMRKENQVFKEFYEMEYFPEFDYCVEREIGMIKNNAPFEEPSIVKRGLYYNQIKSYYKFFETERVKIIGFRDLIDRKTETLNDILDFVGLPKNEWAFLLNEKKHAREYVRPVRQETMRMLEDFYRPHNEQLFNLIGKEINW
jgi:hypothetical protein